MIYLQKLYDFIQIMNYVLFDNRVEIWDKLHHYRKIAIKGLEVPFNYLIQVDKAQQFFKTRHNDKCTFKVAA